MASVSQGTPTRKGIPYDVVWYDATGRKRSKHFYDSTRATKEAGRIEDALDAARTPTPRRDV